MTETAPAISLRGCRVVVTRPREQAGILEDLLATRGATVVSLPTIAITGPESIAPLEAALRELAEGAYEWVVFLSANAVNQTMNRFRALELPPSAIRSRVAAVGAATATALAAAAVAVDLQPDASTAAGVAATLGAGSGRVLVPRAADAPADALDAMRSRGWQVDEVTAYRTVTATEGAGTDVVRRGEFDVVTFTSGSTVRGFATMVAPAEAGLTPEDPGERKVACIGPVTAKTAAELGFRVDAVATEQSDEGLVRAVVDLHLGQPHR